MFYTFEKLIINENRHLKWKLCIMFPNVNKCHYLYFMIMFHGRVHSSHWHQAWVWQIVTLISLYYVWLPRLLLSLCGNQALGDTRSHDARPELVQLECVIVLWKLSFEVDANSIVPLFAPGCGNITNNPRLCERGLCWKYMTPQFFSPVLCLVIIFCWRHLFRTSWLSTSKMQDGCKIQEVFTLACTNAP